MESKTLRRVHPHLYPLVNFVQALFLVTWSFFWIVVAGLASLFSSEWPLVLARKAWAPGLIAFTGAQVEVLPGPELNSEGPYVFVMNHQSMFDIPLAFAKLPFNLRFVYKRSLLFVPVLGFYLWRTKMIPVDRSRAEQAYASLQVGVLRLKAGSSILAFPEGTRSPGRVRAFKRGAFLLAQAAGAAVVPVAIEGSGEVLAPGTFRVRARKVRMKIGDPIPTVGLASGRKALDALRDRARDEVSRLKAELTSSTT